MGFVAQQLLVLDPGRDSADGVITSDESWLVGWKVRLVR